MHHTTAARSRPSQRRTGAHSPYLDNRAHASKAPLGVGGDTQPETPPAEPHPPAPPLRRPADDITADVGAPRYLGYPTYLGIWGVVPRRRSEPAMCYRPQPGTGS